MQDKPEQEKVFFRLRMLALIAFYMMLVGGIAMIGLGAATHLILFLIDGAMILVGSTIFFAIAYFARIKQKKLNLEKSGV